jgi:hypothetical protein
MQLLQLRYATTISINSEITGNGSANDAWRQARQASIARRSTAGHASDAVAGSRSAP